MNLGNQFMFSREMSVIFHVFTPLKGRDHGMCKNAQELNTANQQKIAQAIWNSC